MPRPTKVPLTPLQIVVDLFMDEPLPEAIAMLETVNAIILHRVEAEHYVPTAAAQDSPARPRSPRPAAVGRPRGRPPAAKPAEDTAAAASTPPPPETPPGADQGAPPAPPSDASGEPEGGSLTMPSIGGASTPTPPVAAPGGRAQTT